MTYQKNTGRSYTQSCFPKGFTLIELLVVVLIIGILAAVAVPQYQKATEKAKATQAFSIIRTMLAAYSVYVLENGEYPIDFNDLDIDLPFTDTTSWSDTVGIDATRANEDWSVQLYRNSAGDARGVSIGRLRGKYKGAAFIIFSEHPSLNTNTIYCVERLSSGLIFEGEPGDYCVKLFGGTLKKNPAIWRLYEINS